MDMAWSDERSGMFVTNVGLVTSTGPHGDNVMSAEWTHHLSYSPGLVGVSVGLKKATLENVRETREFGVSIASSEQATLASIAGGWSGRDVDKIGALKELGFGFEKASKIKALLVEGAVFKMECRLIKEVPVGDHILLLGEVLEASQPSGKVVLAYHKRRYGTVEFSVPKPTEEERERQKRVLEKFRKK